MATKTKAYVDTSAFISFLDRSDSHHELFKRIFATPPNLITSPLVIAEGHGWFLRRYDSIRANQFLSFIEDLSPLQIIKIGSPEILSAKKYIQRFKDQSLTLADAVGLLLMDELKIKDCWSTDRHLGLTGRDLAIHSR